MEIELIEEDVYGDYLLINYTKLIKNSNELCIVCQVDETEEGKQWDRFQVVCQHIAHTRCLRRWCSKQEMLNCTYCGNIKRKSINRFCKECNTFGHTFGNCNPVEFIDNDLSSSCCNYTKLMNLCLSLK